MNRQRKGYIEGERYEGKLKRIQEHGNKLYRYVTFIDEKGVLLTWKTSARTKCYNDVTLEGHYSFGVIYIPTSGDDIYISRVQRIKRY